MHIRFTIYVLFCILSICYFGCLPFLFRGWDCRRHYENTPMQNTAIFRDCKNDNFQLNCLTVFIFLLKIYIVGTR